MKHSGNDRNYNRLVPSKDKNDYVREKVNKDVEQIYTNLYNLDLMTHLTNLGLSIEAAQKMIEQEKEVEVVKKLLREQKEEERRPENTSSQRKQ